MDEQQPGNAAVEVTGDKPGDVEAPEEERSAVEMIDGEANPNKGKRTEEEEDEEENDEENGAGAESVGNEEGGDEMLEDQESDSPRTLEYADRLMERGEEAMRKGDVAKAVDMYSEAVEIRVAHFGELDIQCFPAYYKYGCALLRKSQEDNEPLAISDTLEKKAAESSKIAGPSHGETSSSIHDTIDTEGNEVADTAEVDAEDASEESDLDQAFIILDIARVILEKYSEDDTLEKANVFAALGDVSLEREDIETCLSDYGKALIMLERLVDQDSRLLAELHFKFCVAFQLIGKISDSITHCKTAISIIQARSNRIKMEIGPASDGSGLQHEELSELDNLLIDLNAKLDDLAEAPPTEFAELMADVRNTLVASKAAATTSSTNGTSSKNGNVTHLGVVGRGVKRAAPFAIKEPDSSAKKTVVESVQKMDVDLQVAEDGEQIAGAGKLVENVIQ